MLDVRTIFILSYSLLFKRAGTSESVRVFGPLSPKQNFHTIFFQGVSLYREMWVTDFYIVTKAKENAQRRCLLCTSFFLCRIFLYDKGGNPNKTNAKKETALHCVCVEKNSQFYNVQKRRVECLNMILNWRGATLHEGQVEKIDVGAADEVCMHFVLTSFLLSFLCLPFHYFLIRPHLPSFFPTIPSSSSSHSPFFPDRLTKTDGVNWLD